MNIKEEKRNRLEEEMKSIYVSIISGKKVPLYYLCQHVKNRVLYFNFIESRMSEKDGKDLLRKNPDVTPSSTQGYVIKKKVHDYGFIFEDGFQVRHVDKKYFDLFDNDIIEVIERF